MMPLENKAVHLDAAPVRVTLARPWDGHDVGAQVYVPASVATALLLTGIAR